MCLKWNWVWKIFKMIDVLICNILEIVKWLFSYFLLMLLIRWIIYIVFYIFKYMRNKLDFLIKNSCILFLFYFFK